MEYTKNYKLPQWVETDRILMEDFNAAMADIEIGLDVVKAEAIEKADAAQTTADSAVSKAEAAQNTVDEACTPNNKPYVTGSYTGNGGTKTISVGFEPSAVVISSSIDSTAGAIPVFFSAGNVRGAQNEFTVTATGFQVEDGINSYSIYWLNTADMAYYYIAFK